MEKYLIIQTQRNVDCGFSHMVEPCFAIIQEVDTLEEAKELERSLERKNGLRYRIIKSY